ncbi:hypothetical protein FOMPIDRAFT_1017066 [Fomitopsis schrenkii]|uniref:Aminoglycoside phosphotransferase domain-containing protein n=1 Tax=Fomitopsis schrenkii TaxID=2126942 RepID=S8E885_FOMSC|nr:hypothetical protein FOMPIDRAFT_1017066 [Fomitopsis schrenkii]
MADLESPLDTYVTPSEEALNAVYKNNFTAMCGVNIAHVVDTVRNILRLPKDAIPTTLRILDHGSYNKLFLIQFGPTSLVARVPFRHKPSANDPIGIASQVSTSQFLSIYRPKLPVPKILYAELNSANKANVPFVLYELCNGTRLTWQKWSRTQTAAQKANIVDLLAEKWAQLTEPVPFMAIGSILADASGHPPDYARDSRLRRLPTRPPASSLALVHPDYATTRNVLFSTDRTHIEGIVDWDDAVVIPRDIAAMYPNELMTRAWWQVDPDLDDLLAIPPETEQEKMRLTEIAVEETRLRQRFRETVRRFDPQMRRSTQTLERGSGAACTTLQTVGGRRGTDIWSTY